MIKHYCETQTQWVNIENFIMLIEISNNDEDMIINVQLDFLCFTPNIMQ